MSTVIIQKSLNTILNEALIKEGTPEEEKYKSVVGMVYTLVEDGRLDELHQVIKSTFPEYYN